MFHFIFASFIFLFALLVTFRNVPQHIGIPYLGNRKTLPSLAKTDIFILGDMNVNYKNKSSRDFKKVSFFAQSNGLTQHIKNTTRNTDKSKSLLDIAFSNSKFVSCSGTLDHFISDHQPIFIIHKKGRDKRRSEKFTGRSYRDFNRASFEEELLKGDWDAFFKLDNVEETWDFILNKMTYVLDAMCPLRTYHIKNYRPEWMTSELIEQIKDRDYFYKKAKMKGNRDDWNIAKFLRNTTNSNIRQAKRDFILERLRANEQDAKKFWKTIHSVIPSKKGSSTSEILLKDNRCKIAKDNIAHFINEFFVNVGAVHGQPVNQDLSGEDEGNDINLSTESPDTSDPIDSSRKISKNEVLKIVKEINISKSSGILNISSYILKEAFSIILSQITRMFNLSLDSGLFPTKWKEALVIPIPKSGTLTDVNNYRPNSLLPLPGKILEKLVHRQLSGFLESNSLLSDSQHGFRAGRSTLHSIAQFTKYVNTKLDLKLPTLVTYIDFRKAFDCVQHKVLLDKLKHLGLSDMSVKWIRSYLTNRKQRVLANNVYSFFLNTTQGVPQGSVLGPLFYIIYANDLPDLLQNCNIALYADDTILYTANANFEDSITKMQRDISSLASWCSANGVSVNATKTKTMLFGSPNVLNNLPAFEITYNKTPLQKVTSYKYLGVTLDYHLNYNLHVNKIISSASCMLKQFQRMRNFLTVNAAVLVYKSMLLPILEYGDILLSATTAENRKKLQTLQNKGLRCALNKGLETSSADLHAEANLLKLCFRREQHLLNFMYDLSWDPSYIKLSASTMVTRSQSKRLLKLKKPRTEKFKKSLAYYGPKKWNALPVKFHQSGPKPIFKNMTETWVSSKSESKTESKSKSRSKSKSKFRSKTKSKSKAKPLSKTISISKSKS